MFFNQVLWSCMWFFTYIWIKYFTFCIHFVVVSVMEVIVDELRKNNVDVDIQTLSQHINYVLARHGQLYDEMAERLDSDGLLNVFGEINVNNFGRAMAYLTLIYLMDIPEDVKREAVRLVAPVLRDVGVTRVEEGFFRRMFSWIRCVLAIWTIRIETMVV